MQCSPLLCCSRLSIHLAWSSRQTATGFCMPKTPSRSIMDCLLQSWWATDVPLHDSVFSRTETCSYRGSLIGQQDFSTRSRARELANSSWHRRTQTKQKILKVLEWILDVPIRGMAMSCNKQLPERKKVEPFTRRVCHYLITFSVCMQWIWYLLLCILCFQDLLLSVRT